jgi:protein-L-isoaspartate O-methyltransferase
MKNKNLRILFIGAVEFSYKALQKLIDMDANIVGVWERIRSLVIETKNRFKKLNIHNINLKYDDGTIGWKNYAPFDRILFSASSSEIPETLFEQLNENGILLVYSAKGFIRSAPWLIMGPGIMITLLALGLALIGEGLGEKIRRVSW